MAYDAFVTVLDRVSAHALRLSLYDQGEPLLHPDIYRMVGAASDRGIGTLICTNFNSFREEHLEPLFRSRLTVLSPCLDGYSQATYERYRKGGRVDRVKEAIRRCAARKRATGERYPIIDVQVVLFPHLRSELPAIDGFLRACRVDRITYRQEILGYSDADGTFSAARRRPVGVRRCHWLYLGMLVATDGSVYPCCAGDWGRRPYGNLLQQDLDSIWNNRLYRFSRALFTEGPDLAYDPELAQVPCLRCELFPPRRRMRPPPAEGRTTGPSNLPPP